MRVGDDAFRRGGGLGDSSRRLYLAADALDGRTTNELADGAQVNRGHARRLLARMAEDDLRMVESLEGRWYRREVDLDWVAETLGTAGAGERQRKQYEVRRATRSEALRERASRHKQAKVNDLDAGEGTEHRAPASLEPPCEADHVPAPCTAPAEATKPSSLRTAGEVSEVAAQPQRDRSEPVARDRCPMRFPEATCGLNNDGHHRHVGAALEEHDDVVRKMPTSWVVRDGEIVARRATKADCIALMHALASRTRQTRR